MFTGLIASTGTLISITPTEGAARLLISAPEFAGRWSTGDSIAVNGVCLTALHAPDPDTFSASLATETVERTTLSHLAPGTLVNLELPTPSGAPLGGHVVQGHVDATGTFVSLVPLHPGMDATDWRLTVEIPASMTPYIVPQGSITVDGISLTVARVEGQRVEIAIIPHTHASTNLRGLVAGSAVNLEADVLSKYVARRAPSTLTVGYLLANGY
ncbi:MAG TPA: riboflavin synthase [Acidobacteriaceae bacterium]|nr:riboflavin synthase [Acidobacteriaceae bacterium]